MPIEMLESPDRDAAGRAMEAMLGRTKLDVAKLREAFEGVPARAELGPDQGSAGASAAWTA